MNVPHLTGVHKERYQWFCDFVATHVSPDADIWDQQQEIPYSIIRKVAEQGFFGAIMPKSYGGSEWDYLSFGLLNEALGRGSSSLTVLLTVQNMAATCIKKWGTKEQLSKWIEPIANGDILAAFALTEPNVGSNIQGIETEFVTKGDSIILNGTKRWITFGELADVYLIFGKAGAKSVACIVEKNRPGVTVKPIRNMLGFRASHLAQLEFNDVELPKENIIGKIGFAISHVAPVGLHYGRLSTAFSSVGLTRACLETSIQRAAARKIGTTSMNTFSSVRDAITDIGVSYETSLSMCLNAAHAEDLALSDVIEKTILAKYIASRNAVSAATETVQLLGAHGCHEESSSAGRYYRDAKIMEIIEGTNQVLKNVMSDYFINSRMNELVS